MKLKDSINEFKEISKARLSDDDANTYIKGTQDLIDAKLSNNALNVGENIPDIKLPNAKGEIINVNNITESNYVVINFYRGGWCPYCNLELKALENKLDSFKELNVKLVAISPETPDNSLSTQEKNSLKFEVLSDVKNVIAKKFKLVFVVNENVNAIYKEHGVNIAKSNGDDSKELPMPATYIVNKSGKIIYAFVDEDYTKRAEPDDIIEAIKSDIKNNNLN